MAAAFRCCWYRRRSSRHSVSLVARWRLRYLRQARTRARQTCSRVICGFFPPELRCVQTDERQGHQAQRHMTFQRHITASLEVGQADFALGDAEQMFHMPTHERGQEHPPQADASCVGDEVFLLPRLPIACQDQSASRLAVGPHSHVHGLRLPHRRRAGLLLKAERFRCPFLHARLRKHGQRGSPRSRFVLGPTRETTSASSPHKLQGRRVQHAQPNPGLPPYPSSKVSQSKCQPFRSARANNSMPICHFGR